MATHDLSLLEEMADRVLVLSENHELVADTTVSKILRQKSFLVKHNLMHDHGHFHGKMSHEHIHMHAAIHGHT